MKIAVITDDGLAVSQHFGRAAKYLVVTVENGQVIERQLRDKMGHAHFSDEPHAEGKPGQPHGFDPAAQNRHMQMAKTISDCQVLLCGGMGRGAYESMRAQGIEPVVTDETLIDEALRAYIEGRIVDRTDRLH
jgi:predicted Fe-Mo cluster-binding NifX family protein